MSQQQNVTEEDHIQLIQPIENEEAKDKLAVTAIAEVAKPSKSRPSKPLKEVIKIVGPSASTTATTAAATLEPKRSVGRPRKHPLPQHHEAVTSTKSKKPANASKKPAVPKKKKGLQIKKNSKKHNDVLDEYLGSEDDTESEEDEGGRLLASWRKEGKIDKEAKVLHMLANQIRKPSLLSPRRRTPEQMISKLLKV